jgi:sugar phosphate isomerase/epimerase/cytochrome c551/c552
MIVDSPMPWNQETTADFAENADKSAFHPRLPCDPRSLLLLAGVVLSSLSGENAKAQEPSAKPEIFARENLVAWCIVPFDSKQRSPEERAAMLKELGFTKFAYDYRAEHIPTFDAEVEALKKQGIELTAWWFPGALNSEARIILDVLKRHEVKSQLWVTGGGEPTKSPEEQATRVNAEAARIRPIAEEAAKIGCTVALYNHGGWFGEPENQLAIIDELKLPNVGIVYNQHHGHDHLARFGELLPKMLPHLVCLNLNGMMPDGERRGQKILPLGQGELDLALLKTIRTSGYRGPIGILGHTQDDAEERLLDNLDGLDWLVKQLDGKPPGEKPKTRTPVPAPQAPAPKQASKPKLGEGKFGQALDAKSGGLVMFPDERYRRLPLTVECWAKLEDLRGYNILVANEPKSSGTHWELFTMAGSGTLTVYLPGAKPDHVRSEAMVVDGKWHYLAMQYAADRVRLFVDGKEVANQPIERGEDRTVKGELAIGRLPTGEIGCSGLIDDVRISSGIREITAVPEKPLAADEHTIGLWPLDELGDKGSPDASGVKNAARIPTTVANAPSLDKTPPEHWGREVIGFDWKEADSVDNRWNQTQIGPFLASIVPLPGQKPVEKGLSIKVGDRGQGTVCYDTQTLALRAGWTGGFLKFDPARYGLINSPQIAGKLAFVPSENPRWDAKQVQYVGLQLHHPRVVLSARVDGTLVRESPWLAEHDGQAVFTKSLAVGPRETPLDYLVGQFPGEIREQEIDRVKIVSWHFEGAVVAIAASGQAGLVSGEMVRLRVPPGQSERSGTLHAWSGSAADLPKFAAAVKASPPPESLDELAKPGPPRWTEEIITQGQVGTGKESPYVVDTLTLPFDNPYKALMFVGGHDFFANGDMAICTVHGDVWRMSGVNDKLDHLVWKRFATGLFQPLGLKVVDDHVHVLGRDQITRLVDRNGDGEADEYQCFTNAYRTSAGGHDYVTCLDADLQGRLHFVHATEGLLRVAKDGSRVEQVATGFRNPNGMSVGPNDELTVAPQEGEWTPGSVIFEVRPGGYYGYGGPKAGHGSAGHDPPLAWLPRMMDNSSGGQAWITSDRWGLPGKGSGVGVQGSGRDREGEAPAELRAAKLLHFSYGKCRMMLVLREQVGEVMQGAVIEIPGVGFSSGAMRGCFSPHDGQLYVSGLKGWASAAVDDGCLQRVRFTGRPLTLPIDRQTFANGLAITFSQPLDRETAEDPGSYHLEQWNYRYSGGYGSPDLKVSDPAMEGHDEVAIRSATLLDGGRTVFLEIPNLQPANQLSIEYSLRTAAGQPLRQTLVATTHVVPERRMDESKLHRREPTKESLVDESSLAPGVLLRFSQGDKSSIRTGRLIAWHIPADQPAGGGLSAGPFAAKGTGYVKVPLRGEYQFHFTGTGTAKLYVNSKLVLAAPPELKEEKSARATLHQGFNRVEVEYSAPDRGTADFRLWWTDGTFAAEPIPPTALWHDAHDEALLAADQLRLGVWIAGERRCNACHAVPGQDRNSRPTGPSLASAGSRLDSRWVYHWLLDPSALRPQAHMPRLFAADQPAARQAAADIAAYLATLGNGSAGALPSQSSPSQAAPSQDPPASALFEDLGCIACHRLTPATEADAYDRLTLAHVARKFRPGKLVEFLRKPQAHFPLTAMPDFSLSAGEAESLAQFLTGGEPVKLPATPELERASAERGESLFRERRCIACHAVSDAAATDAARAASIPVRDLARGCLASKDADRGATPRFQLSAADSAAVTALYRRKESALPSMTPSEMLPQMITSLRCGACHNRDHAVAPLRWIVAEESEHGLAPDPLPNLTWTGEKLHGEWIRKQLAGELPYRSRPWLKARMPAFPQYATALVEGLSSEHGISFSHGTESHSADRSLAQLGDRLTRKEGGLDCRSCHAIGKEQPTGDDRTRVAQGINFAHTRERMREEFYERFVLDPQRYDISTRMPKLAADGRTTNVASVADGDARQQFAAIWQYLQMLPPHHDVESLIRKQQPVHSP